MIDEDISFLLLLNFCPENHQSVKVDLLNEMSLNNLVHIIHHPSYISFPHRNIHTEHVKILNTDSQLCEIIRNQRVLDHVKDLGNTSQTFN